MITKLMKSTASLSKHYNAKLKIPSPLFTRNTHYNMRQISSLRNDDREFALQDPVKTAQFKFKNAEKRSGKIELIREDNQTRPANWPKQSVLEDIRG
jgi:hypothetical protein